MKLIQFLSLCSLFITTSCGSYLLKDENAIDKKTVELGPPIITPIPAPIKEEPTTPTTYTVTPKVQKFCSELQKKFTEYRWGKVDCENHKWHHVRSTHFGTPLIWTSFGKEKDPASQDNTTLIMCGVHGDEITPIKFCWDLIAELKNHKFVDKQVIVVPLVAPDSFLKARPTRTNGRGVDVNRNFPTKDWKSSAHSKWKHSGRGDKRKYPGDHSASEQETIFQMNLITRYNPNKVISVHSPLTILDYDGPSFTANNGKSAMQLLEEMSRRSSGYKISNYPVFPGSLGNWSGKERHIPTYTLELPNSDPRDTNKFWHLFKDAVLYAIDTKMGPVLD